MMKKCLLTIVALLLLSGPAHSGFIVNNSGTTSADSFTITFEVYDSAGNPGVALASGDSIFLEIHGGEGARYADSGNYLGTGLAATLGTETFSTDGFKGYHLRMSAATLLSSGTFEPGPISYRVSVYDKTSADLWSISRGTAQLYETRDFDATLDFVNQTIFDPVTEFVMTDSIPDGHLDLGKFSGPGAFWNEGKTGYALSASGNTAIYTEFTSGTNEDVFKANVSALALEASLFDPATDFVMVDSIPDGHLDLGKFSGPSAFWNEGKTGYALTTADQALIADTVYGYFTYATNEDPFKANVSALALEATVAGLNDVTPAEIWAYATKNVNVSSISSAAIEFSDFAGSAPTAWWNEGKTGYSLTQAFPSNFSALSITAGGTVNADVVALATNASAATNLGEVFDNDNVRFTDVEWTLTQAEFSAEYYADIDTTLAAVHGTASWVDAGAASPFNSVIVKKGVVGGTPGTTGFRSTALSEATTDYWNDNQVLLINGTITGQVARITAFTPGTDSITVTPAFTAAPTAGDSFYVLGILGENPAAGSADWSSSELNQIRYALGIDGDVARPSFGDTTGVFWMLDTLRLVFPTNFPDMNINGSGNITVGTNTDKTNYTLSTSQGFNNTGTWTGNISGNVTGSVNSVATAVTVGTNNDKTGYALSTAGVKAVADSVWGHLTYSTNEQTFWSLTPQESDSLLSLRNGTGSLYVEQIVVNAADAGGAIELINSAGPGLYAQGTTYGGYFVGSGGSATAGLGATSALNGAGMQITGYSSDLAFGGTMANSAILNAAAKNGFGYAIFNHDLSGYSTANTAGLFIDAQISAAGGGGLTVADIADGVWNEDRTGHTTSNTFGLFLDAQISGISGGAGSGPYACSVLVEDGGTPISNVKVWAYPNDGGTALKTVTDANGWAQFGCVADTFLLYTWAAGWNAASIPDTLFVPSENSHDTVEVNAVSVGSPSSPSLTLVSMYFYDKNGAAIKEVPVSYELETERGQQIYHLDSAKVVSTGQMGWSRSDANGRVTFEVIPNDSIVVAPNELGTTRYRVKAMDPRTGLPLLGPDGILMNVTASATEKRYPQDF